LSAIDAPVTLNAVNVRFAAFVVTAPASSTVTFWAPNAPSTRSFDPLSNTIVPLPVPANESTLFASVPNAAVPPFVKLIVSAPPPIVPLVLAPVAWLIASAAFDPLVSPTVVPLIGPTSEIFPVVASIVSAFAAVTVPLFNTFTLPVSDVTAVVAPLPVSTALMFTGPLAPVACNVVAPATV